MTTQVGFALAERHRVAQAQIAATTLQQMLVLWALLVDGGDIEANTRRWLDTVLAVLGPNRARSAALSAQFHRAYRLAELGEDFVPTAATALPVEALTTSLMVLGPTAYRRDVAKQLNVPARELTPELLRQNRLPRDREAVLAATVAASAIRHVRNGDRETSDDVFARDPRVRGYVRMTRANPCWFCAMLASRGPVYVDDSFEDSDPRFHGPGDAKVHDSCGCNLRPLYSRDGADFLPRVREYEALWQQTRSALAFRRAYEGRARNE